MFIKFILLGAMEKKSGRGKNGGSLIFLSMIFMANIYNLYVPGIAKSLRKSSQSHMRLRPLFIYT